MECPTDTVTVPGRRRKGVIVDCPGGRGAGLVIACEEEPSDVTVEARAADGGAGGVGDEDRRTNRSRRRLAVGGSRGSGSSADWFEEDDDCVSCDAGGENVSCVPMVSLDDEDDDAAQEEEADDDWEQSGADAALDRSMSASRTFAGRLANSGRGNTSPVPGKNATGSDDRWSAANRRVNDRVGMDINIESKSLLHPKLDSS